MSVDIPRPNINAPTESARLEQVRSYLYQVSEQLNWALNTIETDTSNKILEISRQNSASSGSKPDEVQSNFNSIKALIIKSADIVEEYYEKITEKLKLTGYYVAQSEFGTFKEDTSLALEGNANNIKLVFEDIQQITSDLEYIHDQYIDSDAYIKSGILYYDSVTGAAVYGLEIGQTNTIDGEKVFDKFARFTSDRLSFYDNNDVEVAYISDYELVITRAKILSSLIFGETSGYVLDTTDGIAFLWEEEHKKEVT